MNIKEGGIGPYFLHSQTVSTAASKGYSDISRWLPLLVPLLLCSTCVLPSRVRPP